VAGEKVKEWKANLPAQGLLFALLAPIGRLFGYRARYDQFSSVVDETI